MKNLIFNEIEVGNNISNEKKKDISALVEKHSGVQWRIRPELSFFADLLDMAIETTTAGDQEASNSDVEDDPECVACDQNPARVHSLVILQYILNFFYFCNRFVVLIITLLCQS